MIIRLDTVQFAGSCHVDCRKCQRRSTFPNGASVLMYDYGNVLVIRSANSRAIFHECGQEFYWRCDSCGEHPNITILAKHLRAKRRRVLQCSCGSEYSQHRLELVPHGEEDVEDAVTPF